MDNSTSLIKRRQILKTSVIGLGSLAFAPHLIGLGQSALAQNQTQNPFRRAYALPPLNTGDRSGNQVHFKLDLREGSKNFIGNLTTRTWGINGDYLGPVLRAHRGDKVSFSVHNSLQEAVALHWHGFILPAQMDGGPHQYILPGQTWQPSFEVIQAASTNFFHSHTHNKTGEHTYRGLAGLFYIDDETSSNLNLPTDYGVNDFPVVIQDRAFNRNGSFRYLSSMPDRMHGMHGDVMLINGVVTPTLAARSSLIRLRLLNASNARTYTLAFKDSRSFSVIAGDGGFLTTPVRVQNITLAPAERAEILLDLSDGRDAILYNQAVKNSGGGMMGMMGMGQNNQRFDIMRISAPQTNKKAIMPQQLITQPTWINNSPTKKRNFELQMQMGPRMMMSRVLGSQPFSISGKSMDMNVINHRVKANSLELWEISNPSMLAHPFHIHNTQFQIVARSSQPITPLERGLKDTVLVYPNEKVRLLVPFAHYSDPKYPYMYHCHILEHEDGGMMGQFTVEA